MPLTWGKFRDYTFEYLKHHPYEMQIFKPDVSFIEDDKMFKLAFFFKNELPTVLLEKLAKVPGIGTAAIKKTAEKGRLMTSKAWETGVLFDHFTTNSWIYESVQVDEIQKLMTPEEREVFFIDAKLIDWHQAIQSYVHGIQRFCLK